MRVMIDRSSSNNNAFINFFSDAVRAAGAEVVPFQPYFQRLRTLDTLIFHWPALYMGKADFKTATKSLLRIMAARRLGKLKLVWVAHNVDEHDGPSSHPIILRRFLSELDGVIYLSHRSRDIIRAAYTLSDRTEELVTVHGVYEPVVPTSERPAPSDGEACRLLTFGLIRQYKGYEALIDAAKECDPGRFTIGLMGRRFDPEYAAKLERDAATNAALSFQLHDEHIEDADLERAIDAANGVVLPYNRILNSGAAIHALSMNRPILVPNQGSMPELRELVGADWITLYDGSLSYGHLEGFRSHLARMPTGSRPDLSALQWTRVQDDLRDFFARINRKKSI